VWTARCELPGVAQSGVARCGVSGEVCRGAAQGL